MNVANEIMGLLLVIALLTMVEAFRRVNSHCSGRNQQTD